MGPRLVLCKNAPGSTWESVSSRHTVVVVDNEGLVSKHPPSLIMDFPVRRDNHRLLKILAKMIVLTSRKMSLCVGGVSKITESVDVV